MRTLFTNHILMWLQIATGFTGAFTLLFLFRRVRHWFGGIPSVQAHFSPKGGCLDAVVRELQHARHEILVQAYSFTANPITTALIDAKKRGVHVDVILDRSNEQEPHTDLPVLIEKNLAPLIDAKHAIAHNKVMIVDRRTLITGSFNFTHQAEVENAENLLVIKGHPELLALYRQNFLAHKAHSQPPNMQAVQATHHRAA